MIRILFIGFGGFFGCIARYAWTAAVNRSLQKTLPHLGSFPLGTMSANLSGSFFIGLIAAFFLNNELHPNYRLFFVVGLLGGFTTFSSFSLETLQLLKKNDLMQAGIYSLGSVLFGLILVWAGFSAGRMIISRWL